MQLSLGLIFGGIAGNLSMTGLTWAHRQHVIDFLRFYMYRHNGEEIGFPAFNVADSAICIGVGLLLLVSWKLEADSKRRTVDNEPAPSKE